LEYKLKLKEDDYKNNSNEVSTRATQSKIA